MFQKPSSTTTFHTPPTSFTPLQSVTGPWKVSFPPDRGAPSTVTFDQLHSWTENESSGVRYFSGAARYSKTIAITDIESEKRLLLDLGKVANIAEVSVNGHSAGVAWKAPYRVDITDFVHEGSNQIDISVANLWPNRLIGDRQPDAERQYAQAAYNPFNKDSPLQQSGLLGPVRLLTAPR
ncbi:glycosylhydrolase-like jelly roll fold domain-containing protein [Microbulbifer sp. SH-1]|uniref:glycosylhydrolase-like jelly roll fold domain-containing protein n=1 Tax=Microbulbifer sp. SH-1 TaxID=2681547 RepID=UPI001F0F3B2A|nr:glycosylhydrolase-like jelly roll fold domain-containing protein [Microbulbifer sp. SH-1]